MIAFGAESRECAAETAATCKEDSRRAKRQYAQRDSSVRLSSHLVALRALAPLANTLWVGGVVVKLGGAVVEVVGGVINLSSCSCVEGQHGYRVVVMMGLREPSQQIVERSALYTQCMLRSCCC